ncbi:MAG: TlyA family RNA methyltransferase [Oscillospiraceae bacterium]
MKHKERLDVLLVARNLAESRSKAQAMIMAGEVYVNEQKADKAGLEVNIDEDPVIEVRGSACPYVSRGGLKLEKALRDFGVDDRLCLQRLWRIDRRHRLPAAARASKVFAIDVATASWRGRSFDPRVVVMERTNIRYVTPEDLGEPLDLSVVDVSFISLKIVLPAIQKLLKPTGQVLCLIKPQFEAGKENVGKKGVVRDPAVHADVLQSFLALADSLHFTVRNLTFSRSRARRAISNSSRIFPCSRDKHRSRTSPRSSRRRMRH